MAERLANCVAWGFVLSWLTLKARSVVPAGLSHGLLNALYTVHWQGQTPSWVLYALWATLALILFRFWPPNVGTNPEARPSPDDELQDRGGIVESPA
jgi:hypothetical protein